MTKKSKKRVTIRVSDADEGSKSHSSGNIKHQEVVGKDVHLPEIPKKRSLLAAILDDDSEEANFQEQSATPVKLPSVCGAASGGGEVIIFILQ